MKSKFTTWGLILKEIKYRNFYSTFIFLFLHWYFQCASSSFCAVNQTPFRQIETELLLWLLACRDEIDVARGGEHTQKSVTKIKRRGKDEKQDEGMRWRHWFFWRTAHAWMLNIKSSWCKFFRFEIKPERRYFEKFTKRNYSAQVGVRAAWKGKIPASRALLLTSSYPVPLLFPSLSFFSFPSLHSSLLSLARIPPLSLLFLLSFSSPLSSFSFTLSSHMYFPSIFFTLSWGCWRCDACVFNQMNFFNYAGILSHCRCAFVLVRVP